MIPAWCSKVIDFIDKFKQVNNRIGLNILVILIYKDVVFLLLFDDTQNDIFKILPAFSDIDFRQLLHTSHELYVSYVVFDD